MSGGKDHHPAGKTPGVSDFGAPGAGAPFASMGLRAEADVTYAAAQGPSMPRASSGSPLGGSPASVPRVITAGHTGGSPASILRATTASLTGGSPASSAGGSLSASRTPGSATSGQATVSGAKSVQTWPEDPDTCKVLFTPLHAGGMSVTFHRESMPHKISPTDTSRVYLLHRGEHLTKEMRGLLLKGEPECKDVLDNVKCFTADKVIGRYGNGSDGGDLEHTFYFAPTHVKKNEKVFKRTAENSWNYVLSAGMHEGFKALADAKTEEPPTVWVDAGPHEDMADVMTCLWKFGDEERRPCIKELVKQYKCTGDPFCVLNIEVWGCKVEENTLTENVIEFLETNKANFQLNTPFVVLPAGVQPKYYLGNQQYNCSAQLWSIKKGKFTESVAVFCAKSKKLLQHLSVDQLTHMQNYCEEKYNGNTCWIKEGEEWQCPLPVERRSKNSVVHEDPHKKKDQMPLGEQADVQVTPASDAGKKRPRAGGTGTPADATREKPGVQKNPLLHQMPPGEQADGQANPDSDAGSKRPRAGGTETPGEATREEPGVQQNPQQEQRPIVTPKQVDAAKVDAAKVDAAKVDAAPDVGNKRERDGAGATSDQRKKQRQSQLEQLQVLQAQLTKLTNEAAQADDAEALHAKIAEQGDTIAALEATNAEQLTTIESKDKTIASLETQLQKSQETVKDADKMAREFLTALMVVQDDHKQLRTAVMHAVTAFAQIGFAMPTVPQENADKKRFMDALYMQWRVELHDPHTRMVLQIDDRVYAALGEVCEDRGLTEMIDAKLAEKKKEQEDQSAAAGGGPPPAGGPPPGN